MKSVDIVAIEDTPDHYLVHTVRWQPFPEGGSADFGFPAHMVVIPRSDKPVMFAPIADGYYGQRPADRPEIGRNPSWPTLR